MAGHLASTMKRLGRSEISVSVLGLGRAPIGGLYEPVADDQATDAVRAALAKGLCYIDTAPHYGAGRSELRIGRALTGVPRESFVVSTKVGRRLRPLRPGEKPDAEGFRDEPAYKREWDWS